MATRWKVYVTRRVHEEGLQQLRESCDVEVWEGEGPVPREVLIEKIRDAEGLYCLLTEPVDKELLAHALKLRVVSVMAVGVDNVDLDACTRRGIPVGHTPGVLTETTADLTWALLLAAARRLAEAQQAVYQGRWITWEPLGFLGQDVHGKTLGIVGLGRIGSAVARRASGFGMRLLYHNRRPRPELEAALSAQYVDLPTLFREADFVTLHAPLTQETYHLIGEAELKAMKPTAVLVNTARGGLVDHQALSRALKEGWIWAAALDVTEPEPLPPDHPLLTLPNCLITPHIGSASHATRAKMAIMAAENLLAGLRGERLPHCANPQVYEAR
jgi:lactate dehydrogenase-like 2-hydroxyacid dehydrogenase